MVVGNQPGRSPIVRACAALVVLLSLINALATGPAARAVGDGALKIDVWQCPQGVDPGATISAVFGTACTTRADGLIFSLSDPTPGSSVAPIRRMSGYPNPGDPVSWSPPFFGEPNFDHATITLDTPQPGMVSVVFCSDGGVPARQSLEEGDTVLADIQVPPPGLDCAWYLVPGTAPTPEPTAITEPTTAPTTTTPPEPTTAPTTVASPTTEPTTPPQTATATT